MSYTIAVRCSGSLLPAVRGLSQEEMEAYKDLFESGFHKTLVPTDEEYEKAIVLRNDGKPNALDEIWGPPAKSITREWLESILKSLGT